MTDLRARIEALADTVSEMAASARDAEFYGAREGADDLRGVAKLIRDLLAPAAPRCDGCKEPTDAADLIHLADADLCRRCAATTDKDWKETLPS